MHIPVPEEDPQKINDISRPSLIRAAKKTLKGAALTSVGIPAAYYNLGPPSYECPWLSCDHVVIPDGKRMEHSNPLNDFGLRLLSERKTNRQYIAPNVSKVTALIINDFGDGEPSRDISVNKNNSGPQRISEFHPSYVKLQHPLLFPYGDDGFHEKLLIIEIQVNGKQSVDLYHNLCDAVTRDDTSAVGLGKRIVFPRSFTRGPRNPAEINDIISVELPSTIDDPEGYKVVAEYMLHGPYGADAKYAPCTTDGKCSKHFPKSFLAEIVIDEDIYALYYRRNNKVTAKKGNFMYDNKHIVPHNRATVVIQENVKGGQNGTSKQILEVDEIKNFQNCRFLAPCIASLLLPRGRIAHSRFVIPLQLMENITCKIKQNTHLAELLQEVKLIIWDEAPMT
ncbi:ATP-dependent DNA helicase PIF1-like protein [Tanacetum coccineum]